MDRLLKILRWWRKKRDNYCIYNHSRIVDKSFCDPNQTPFDKELCNTHSCPTWSIGSWSECQGSCDQGRRNRTVSCVFKGAQVDHSMCFNVTKPREDEDCEKTECTGWKAHEWSDCSVTCGKGLKSRLVYCELERKMAHRRHNHVHRDQRKNKLSHDTSIFEKVEDSKCQETERPASTTECMLQESCPEWRTTSWTHCNCESGLRTRLAYCSANTQTGCSINLRPKISENCTCTGRWKITRWSEVGYE